MKILSMLLLLSLVLNFPVVAVQSDDSMTAGGWNETIYAQISGIRDGDVTAVSYTGTTSGALTGQDLQYLVRDENDGVRIDILGVPAGTYTLTVTTTSGVLSQEGIVVEAQDRSGYAHFGDTKGVGAYRNDGALKENAIVLYVTEENKDTVTVTSKDGTTVSGIGNILNSRGRSANGGSKTNTNQDILRKLAADGTPLVVRVIGRVTLPFGLTAHNSTDYGGSVGDNGAMARMQGGKDITIEGVGVGATIDGWGLHFICGGGDYARGWGRSFEVRNLSFYNVPEDCVGMEGEQDGDTLNAPVERCWIHHCAFFAPTIANPAESDKSGGDGACDFKRGQYFTNAYCYYEGYHKTNLVGGSDSNLQYHITYHHNHWKNCQSRGPLARQANIHMYNNIFENQSSYCMNPRANAYIFSEYNLFLNSKNPVRVKLGAVKSFQDSFVGCKGDNHATIVSDRSTQVDTACLYANFDTDPALSYIPGGNYLLHADITEMKAVVLAQAGPQGGTAAELPDVPEPPIPGGDVTIPAGSYVHSFTDSGKSSDFYTISGNLSTSKGSVNFAGLTLNTCLKIESSTQIQFYAPESGTLTLVFGGTTAAAGKQIKIDGVKQTIGTDGVLTMQVLAGSHTITKADSVNLFYMACTSDSVTEHIHDYTSAVTTAADCEHAGVTTYTCACGDSYTEPIAKVPHDYAVYADGSAHWQICRDCAAQTEKESHDYQSDGFCALCGQEEPQPAQTKPTEPTQPEPTEAAPTQPQPLEAEPFPAWIPVVCICVLAGIGTTVIVLKKKK